MHECLAHVSSDQTKHHNLLQCNQYLFILKCQVSFLSLFWGLVCLVTCVLRNANIVLAICTHTKNNFDHSNTSWDRGEEIEHNGEEYIEKG